MPELRVVVWGLPRLLGEIVSRIVMTRAHMWSVGQPTEWKELVEMVARKEVDVVILGCDENELPALGNRLLNEQAWLRILAVTEDGREAARYGLWPQRRPLSETSPEALLEAIEEWPDWTRNE